MCWGGSNSAGVIQTQFANTTMSTIFVGGSHACGLNTTNFLVCRGSNNGGQLDFPSNSAYEYSGLALRENYTCAIRRLNGTVVYWGGAGRFPTNVPSEIQFESIVAGLDFTCGLTTDNFSVICWEPGFSNGSSSSPPSPPLLGVIFLELLMGKRAIFKSGEGGVPVSVVDFAVPTILAGDLWRILDKRVGLPEMNEAVAVELVAYTAMHAVNLEGKLGTIVQLKR